MTLVSPNHTTLGSCQNAIRYIYAQKLDPYKVLPKEVLQDLVEQKMKYDAPNEYQCVKKPIKKA
jgi:hypothetical protein